MGRGAERDQAAEQLAAAGRGEGGDREGGRVLRVGVGGEASKRAKEGVLLGVSWGRVRGCWAWQQGAGGCLPCGRCNWLRLRGDGRGYQSRRGKKTSHSRPCKHAHHASTHTPCKHACKHTPWRRAARPAARCPRCPRPPPRPAPSSRAPATVLVRFFCVFVKRTWRPFIFRYGACPYNGSWSNSKFEKNGCYPYMIYIYIIHQLYMCIYILYIYTCAASSSSHSAAASPGCSAGLRRGGGRAY